jgi:hypothetical protein
MGKNEQGHISASNAKKIMTTGRKKDEQYGDTFHSYARQLAAARIGYDITKDISSLSAVEWGLENEWLAVESYCERFLSDVKYPVEFQPHPDHADSVGCTPDAFVGSDGLIEVKCPDSNNHLDNVLDNKQLDDYFAQIQFQLWVTGRKWCDWVSFDPRAPEQLKLHVVRVDRDETFISQLAERVMYLEQCVNEQLELIKEKMK